MENQANISNLPQQPIEPQAVNISPKPKILVISAVVLLLLLLGGAGFVVLQNKNKTSSPFPQAVSQPTSIPTPTPTTAQDKMANWKTYTNNEFKYSLKYPKSWVIETRDSITQIRSSEAFKPDNVSYSSEPIYTADFYIEHHPTNKVITLSDLRQQIQPLDTVSYAQQTEIELRGRPAIKFLVTSVGFNDKPQKGVIIGMNNGFIYIILRNNQDKPSEQKILDKILSNIEFLDQYNITREWKGYTNTTFNFSIHYPSNWLLFENKDNTRTDIATIEGTSGKLIIQKGFFGDGTDNPNVRIEYEDIKINNNNKDVTKVLQCQYIKAKKLFI